MSDVLKKPVHVALLRPAHVQKLQDNGRFHPSKMAPSLSPPVRPAPLDSSGPVIPVTNLLKRASAKMTASQVQRLSKPPTPTPPCSSCKTSPCCYAFAVPLTEAEYESGDYGEYAVALSPEVQTQLQSAFLSNALPSTSQAKTLYYLEGLPGQPCPFLRQDNKCGIYAIRPLVCRVYTCVGDARITQAMRDGSSSRPTDGGNR
jgi:Fe-S-cluster containining protein